MDLCLCSSIAIVALWVPEYFAKRQSVTPSVIWVENFMIKEAKQYRYCCLKKNSLSTMMKIGKASRTECAEVKDLAHRKKDWLLVKETFVLEERFPEHKEKTKVEGN